MSIIFDAQPDPPTPSVLNFPSSPSTNQQYTFGSTTWQWNSYAWDKLSSGVTAFNTRTGSVTLSSSDVTTALTYTPVNAAGDTIGGNVTLSSGTANGVAYLNGSKALTTGSELTFDGENLTFNGTSAPRLLANMSGAQSTRFAIQNSSANGNTRVFLYPNGTGTISAVNGTNNSDPNAANFQAFDLAVIGTTDVRLSSSATGSATPLPITFYAAGSERARITSGGDFCIGTTTASGSGRLTVDLSGFPSTGGLIAQFRGGTTSPTTERYVELSQTYTGASFDSPMLVFRANATASNTSSFGTIRTAADSSIIFSNANNTSSGVSAATERARIDSGGNFIATTSVRANAFYHGTTRYWKSRDNSGGAELVFEHSTSEALSDANIKFRVYSNGNALLAGTFTESSTRKIKKNIRPITDALTAINKLQGVLYDKIDGSSQNEPGLVAEDTAEVLDNLVAYDDEGNPVGVKYTKTVAYLIEAVKELTARLEALESH
jgi:hypothetical protein